MICYWYYEELILLILTDMKKLIIISILALITGAGTTAIAQNRPKEYLGLPGDNLNLYAVMKLFQESETLEGFERSLNDENTRINNLDLNGDGLVDYITVTDHIDGNVHTIVLQDALNQNEKQDVAVFTVQRFSNNSVQIQLIGDEALYGKNYIIEPIYADNGDETPNPGYNGGTTIVRTTTYEIADWPLIRFIYLPNYICWHSSWYWGYYPSFWHPWRPFFWDFYYGYHYNWFPEYYRHYHHWNHYRYNRYNDFYYSGIRSHSMQVSHRISRGDYRATYSHPEQRRDGEALYTRTSGPNSRRSDNTAIGSQERRSVSNSTRERNTTSTRTVTSRGSVTTASDRTRTISNSGNRDNTTRRSVSTSSDKRSSNVNPVQRSDASSRRITSIPDRSGTTSYSGRNAGTSGRSSEFAYNRSNTNINRGQNSVATSRRSAPSVSQRDVSRSISSRPSSSVRSSRQSTPSVSSSHQSSGRSGGGGNAGTRSSGSRGSSGSSNSSHRR
jgi:hypothetical protein